MDGIWAPFWYDNTHKSTGFGSLPPRGARRFPPDLFPLLRMCLPFYEALHAHAIKAPPKYVILVPIHDAVAEC